jgi:hypothetical protein
MAARWSDENIEIVIVIYWTSKLVVLPNCVNNPANWFGNILK